MWSSKDVAYVVLFSVLGFINFATVLQAITMLTGIPGIVYGVDILGAIIGTVTFLIFEGRRWRITVHGIILALITLPTAVGGAPFNLVIRIPIILKLLIVDIVFNSFYGKFKSKDKLLWLAIIQAVSFFTLGPFFDILFFSFFVPFEVLDPLLSLITIMLPLIIILSGAGGYIGYKIYKRVEKIT